MDKTFESKVESAETLFRVMIAATFITLAIIGYALVSSLMG